MLKINDHVLLKKELRNGEQPSKYIILGSKQKPYACQINPNLDYFLYPPGDYDFILGDSEINEHKIHELIYVNHCDIELSIKPL